MARRFRNVSCIVLCWILASVSVAADAAVWPPIRSQGNGLVVSSHALADAAGQAILDRGGNAVDAAVAVGYALAVVHPAAGNLGGGGFAVIRMADGRETTCDFRERAPRKSSRNMYLDSRGEVRPDASTEGYLAAGVPGTVAGLSALLERYGTLSLEELVTPALALAENGFRISARQEQTLAAAAPRLARYPTSRKYFLKPDGSSYKEGDLLVQQDLAATLRAIATGGPDAFYRGPIAALIENDMRRNGGILDKADLDAYRVAWRAPVRGTYRDCTILSMGPPSSGGTHVIQMLNIMENADIGSMGFAASSTVRLMAEAMRQAFADRSAYMGDPDFTTVPVAALTDKSYARSVFERINARAGKALPSREVRPGLEAREHQDTTHYSVVDASGNAVSVTYTINGSYGSAAAVDGAGFLLNNEMDDFAIKPGVPNMYGLVGGEANAVEPEKRPLSSMSPTIVLKNDKVYMVLGSPGGSRIITTVLQVISNVIDHGMDISEAVQAPRFHMQWLPDELRVERRFLVRDVALALEAMGYTLAVRDDMGDVNAILVDPETGVVYGSHDPREEF